MVPSMGCRPVSHPLTQISAIFLAKEVHSLSLELFLSHTHTHTHTHTCSEFWMYWPSESCFSITQHVDILNYLAIILLLREVGENTRVSK